jgi:telomerase reverse transcriptase
LFERCKKARALAANKAEVRPTHLLCDGYRSESRRQSKPLSSIPGLFAASPNERVAVLKRSPWPELLTLLGSAGERIMRHLLLNDAIFLHLPSTRNNYWQLSGASIAAQELDPVRAANPKVDCDRSTHSNHNSPKSITFVRSRILYARAAFNAKGSVRLGLRHVHVLNRVPCRSKQSSQTGTDVRRGRSAENERRLVWVMMYMFPRQFGLHNVFTSRVDKKRTTQKLQDYTMREEEIAAKFGSLEDDDWRIPQTPKRLRGQTKALVQRLRELHERCSYAELLQHCCPAHSSITSDSGDHSCQSSRQRSSRTDFQPNRDTSLTSLTGLATPAPKISAFCRAALAKIIPKAFWGTGSLGAENQAVFLRVVDRFIKLRRFESMSLHDALQGFKISGIEWLLPPGGHTAKPCLSETRKREAIFREFIYYIVDSLLIPLIQSNFYVTESSVHRYKLFYFRHDVWRHVAEPAMAALRTKMFEEIKLEDALAILERRELGFSQVRLLPKHQGMRPIMNLRRRTFKANGKMILGSSINALLAPAQSVLSFERVRRPDKLGSALFSVGDIYTRLRGFRSRLAADQDGVPPKLYFVKVDVQAAFDTIPQHAILELVKKIPSRSTYNIVKYVEMQQGFNAQHSSNVSRKWASLAKNASDPSTFADLLRQRGVAKRKNSVFIDGITHKSQSREALLALLSSHIEQNLVKIGKKFYRQNYGIPQGSVLSSLLCSYFYADLESTRLSFLQTENCLLLRLIDDFLLITTDKLKAIQFAEVMHEGVPAYGVAVNQSKSLANFALLLNGQEVPRITDGQGFPYCGTLLDCSTLEISKDRTTPKDPVVFNALTIESSRAPGQTFQRKVLNSFRIQSAHMFFDTAHNGLDRVLRNLYTAFLEAADKMWAYARCMPRHGRPGEDMVVKAVQELVGYAFGLITSKTRKLRWPGYECCVRKPQVLWLACHAFRKVLVQKQAQYRGVLAWLDSEIHGLAKLRELSHGPIVKVVEGKVM